MTCQECLTTVTTASLQEIRSDAQIRQHSEECEDCSRVVSLITAGESDLAAIFAQAVPSTPPSQTAENAVTRAKRRRMGTILSGVFAVLLAATVWIAWLQVVSPSIRATADMASNHQRTETLKLKCLSPEQAGELISPYVRSNGSLYYLPKSPLRVITVRATPEEMKTVKSLLTQFDNPPVGSCSVAPIGYRILHQRSFGIAPSHARIAPSLGG